MAELRKLPIENNSETGPPRGLIACAKQLGPGLIVAMAWLGTGDFIDAAVAGANYQYALMWAMIVALGARYLVTSALAKYQLCNVHGDTNILQGFQRIWRGFPLLLGVGGFILAFSINGAILRAAGTALHRLTGGIGGPVWGVFLWSSLALAIAVAMSIGRRQYRLLEWVARIVVTVVISAFGYIVLTEGFDAKALISGLSFSIPSDVGTLGAGLVVVSLIGAVGGARANLVYPYMIKDKGWIGPAYRRLQQLDLAFAVASMVVINLLVWIVAAETLNPRGLTVDDEDGLAHMMVLAVGPIGAPLLWLALFAITFDNLHAWSYGFSKLLIDGIHLTKPSRAERYEEPERDPLFRTCEVGALLIIPIGFSLPGMPNLVGLTVAANALNVFLVPAIVVGLVLLTSQKRHMGTWTNRWWHTVLLVIIGTIGIWATIKTAIELPTLVADLF